MEIKPQKSQLSAETIRCSRCQLSIKWITSKTNQRVDYRRVIKETNIEKLNKCEDAHKWLSWGNRYNCGEGEGKDEECVRRRDCAPLGDWERAGCCWEVD